MKKFLKILGIALVSILLLSYIAFLIIPLILNKTLDLEAYKPEIQKLVKENTKLNLDYSKIKFYSTPLLSAGAIIEEPIITFDDGSTLFKSSKIKGGIAIPSLLTLTIKTANCYIENPFINLDIVNSKQYKIVSIIEDIINENIAKPKPETDEENQIPEDLIQKIKIKVPSIKITNYEVLTTDINTKHFLKLKGEELNLGYLSSKNIVKAKTVATLFSDNNPNILADIKFSTVLPQAQKQEEAIDPEEKIQIPFINLVEIYQKYDLKTNIFARLKIRNASDLGYFVYGKLNVDNLNLKLSDIRLPNSFFHADFYGKEIKFDTDIYPTKEEKIDIDGDFKFDKHPRMKFDIISNEIHFENLLNLTSALLDSLNIKHNLKQIKAQGHLIANAQIKTNFKKLKSQGSITVQNGAFYNPMYSIGIKDINLLADFSNNALNLKDSRATINGSKLAIIGYIDNKSNADIKIDVDNLSLPELYNAFAPNEIKRLYSLKSAKLTTHIDVDGTIEKLNAKVKTKLNNLALNDTKRTMFVTNSLADINLLVNPETIKGDFKNQGFNFNMPSIKTYTRIDNLKLDIDNEKVAINPFDFIYNNTSSVNIKGVITNYLKDPNIDVLAKASIKTSDINKTLGKEIAFYVPSRGIIPAKVTLKGNAKKQEILAQISADNNNFISPILLADLAGQPSLINARIDIKGDKIRIKDSGLYRKANSGFSDDLEGNLKGATQLVEFTSIIDNNHINLLRLATKKDLSGKIAIFKKSNFLAKGKLTLNGYFDNLTYDGDFKVNNLSIPELLLKVKTVDLDMLPQGFSLNLDKIDLNSSIIDASLKGDLRPSKIFKVYDIDVNSKFIDVDKALVVADKAMKYVPSSPSGGASNASSADIPLNATGKINLGKIKTGEIVVENIKSDLAIKNNEFILDKLSCNAFKGNILGKIKMHLITQLLTIKLGGKNVDVDSLMANGAGMKDTLSGTAEFKMDINLKGATYNEQVKSLKGRLWFRSKNGVYGPFSKLENFFLAENIRENAFFKNTIGVILSPLTRIDSSHYETLEGKLSFKNGIVALSPITSQGDILTVLIQGNMDLLKNTIDSKVRVRLASAVSDLLGPLALANPINLVKNTPGLNVVTAKLFSFFSVVVPEKEYNQIPDFSAKHSDKNATKFQILLQGDVNKPLKLVKSFKWMVTQKDMDKAEEFSEKFIKEQEELAKQALINQLQKEYEQNNKLKVGVEKILKMDTTAPKVKELILEEVVKSKSEAQREQLKKEAVQEVTTKVQEKVHEKVQQQTTKLQTQLQSTLEKKLQEKLNTSKTQTTPQEQATKEIPPNAGDSGVQE